MELTPDLLLEAKFGSARRGYDMAEVDDFLERCAEGLDVLLSRLRSEFDRAERAEADLVQLRARAGDAPAAALPEPEPEPVGHTEVADRPEAPEAPAPAVGEPMRILIAAERTAEAAIADARAEAERIRSEAEAIASTQRSEAENLLARAQADAEAEARRAGDEAKRAVQSEVVALRRDRDALTDDIRVLRRWLDDQRTRMRTTARDLQRLAEDPSALRDVPVPELNGSAEPADEVAAGDQAGQPPHDDPRGDHVVDIDEPDGEPTQAVAAIGEFRPFDDELSDETTADSMR